MLKLLGKSLNDEDHDEKKQHRTHSYRRTVTFLPLHKI